MRHGKSKAFTMIELLVAVVVAAMLMTAVAAAFDASVTNYIENENIYKSTNKARQAMQRITASLRRASSVALPSHENSNCCSFIDDNGNDYTYLFDSSNNALYLKDNDNSKQYLLCDSVTAAVFTKDVASLGENTVVRGVRISMTITIAGKSSNFNAAAVVRRCTR